MRILHVIPGIAPRYGGPSYAALPFCDALVDCGVEVTLATTDADGPGATLQAPSTRFPLLMFHRSVSERFKYSYDLAKWLGHNVAAFDLVHIHAIFSHSSVSAARHALRGRVPYVLRPLGSLDPWSLQQKRWRKALFNAVFGGRMLGRAAAIHFTTSEEARGAKLPNNRSFILPLGVDERLFALEQATDRASSTTAVFLGRLHPKKNIEMLIDAMRHTPPEWRLVVAGSGEESYERSLRSRAAAARLSSRVEFTGWVDNDQKLNLLRHASVLALPSSQENFGIAVAEAMAAGLPVVISESVNLAPDVLRVNAGWVAMNGQFSEVLKAATVDSSELRKRGANARAFAAAEYRWRAVASRLVREYEAIISESRA